MESIVSQTPNQRAAPIATRDNLTSHPPSVPKAAVFPQARNRRLPMLLVLVALTGLGLWGHYSAWRLPSVSRLSGASSEEAPAWCAAHSVPEAECVECNPSLLPAGKDFGWCRIHGVHNCPLEHPEVAQLPSQPEISDAAHARAERALRLRQRPENNVNCLLYRKRVQFESAATMAKAGVDVAVVEERPMVEAITASGELGYDPTKVARLASPVAGRVWRVLRNVGDRVAEGEVLLLVDAIEIGKAKAELLQALAQVEVRAKAVERQRPLVGGAVSPTQFQEAEAALREAEIRVVS